MRKSIVETIRSGVVLVSDGAWGTSLHKKGLGSGECGELWNADRESDVYDVAKSYVDAGSNIIETNTFQGSRIKLSYYGLEDRTRELNEAGARISRRAAGDGAWVMGSIGPTGKMIVTGDITAEGFYEIFREQAEALAAGGVDAFCIETMSDVDEAKAAVQACRDVGGLEILCTFTFIKSVRGDYRTMMGTSPRDAAMAALEAGADVIGTNCGNGIENMVGIVKEIGGAFPGVPILVQANAGMPENREGRVVFPEKPETTASFVPAILDAGARIVGGCCGTGPDHIRAVKEKVREWSSR